MEEYISPAKEDDLQTERTENDAEIPNHSDESLRSANKTDLLNDRRNRDKIQNLRDKKAAEEEKLAQLEKRQKYYNTEIKICETKMKEYNRKKRNRRIFTRGGMLEAFLREPLLLSDNDVHEFLQKVFRIPKVDGMLT